MALSLLNRYNESGFSPLLMKSMASSAEDMLTIGKTGPNISSLIIWWKMNRIIKKQKCLTNYRIIRRDIDQNCWRYVVLCGIGIASDDWFTARRHQFCDPFEMSLIHNSTKRVRIFWFFAVKLFYYFCGAFNEFLLNFGWAQHIVGGHTCLTSVHIFAPKNTSYSCVHISDRFVDI